MTEPAVVPLTNAQYERIRFALFEHACGGATEAKQRLADALYKAGFQLTPIVSEVTTPARDVAVREEGAVAGPGEDDYFLHVPSGPEGKPRCGAPDPGPLGSATTSVVVCPDCTAVGPEGLRHEETMRGHVQRIRQDLGAKLQAMNETDRAEWKETLRSISASSLADPDCAPALYDAGQLFAALYGIGAARAQLVMLNEAGLALTFHLIAEGLRQLEMITVAMAEGAPL